MREIHVEAHVAAEDRVSAETVAGTIKVWAEGVPGVRRVTVEVGELLPQRQYWHVVQVHYSGRAWDEDENWSDLRLSAGDPEVVARMVLGSYLDAVKNDADDDGAVPARPVRVLIWAGDSPGFVEEAACVLRWNPPGWDGGDRNA